MSSPSTNTAQQSHTREGTQKVIIRLKAAGNAPILKQTFFKISPSQKFQFVINFLRKELGSGPDEPLFLYVNSAFAPAPDELISNLYKCFGIDQSLIINYSTTPVWG
ncbi:hypothetical protein SeMB42_g02199 [Synchytrium endobioticum]|uniref:Ubiquitin-like protein ATG12 n=1 Tax=Synchytrium endobioticum TaxID=286115 RepID=A0A507DFV6_9FUNG|nr:hypothetical protein SeLEV6574_g04381 [Synchytrium endobioticum]TPX50579.1 hypothetical protein SeMB42_g02199 [Synchytrium endobioticum]